MQGTSWIDLFRRIPASLQDGLALGLTTGTEIILQRVIRLEPDFCVIRGRLAGTQDGARVAVVPYTQLVCVAFLKKMTDPEVEAVFGQATPMVAELPAAASEATDEAAAETPDEAPNLSAAPAAVNAAPPAAVVSKAMLLAKLRARLAAASGPADK